MCVCVAVVKKKTCGLSRSCCVAPKITQTLEANLREGVPAATVHLHPKRSPAKESPAVAKHAQVAHKPEGACVCSWGSYCSIRYCGVCVSALSAPAWIDMGKVSAV